MVRNLSLVYSVEIFRITLLPLFIYIKKMSAHVQFLTVYEVLDSIITELYFDDFL